MAEGKEISLILKDHCRFHRIETKKPSATSLEADFGEAEKEEFWAAFFRPNVGLMKVKISSVRKDFLSDWLETDDVRYYEIIDAEQPKVEHGFFNSRREKRLPI